MDVYIIQNLTNFIINIYYRMLNIKLIQFFPFILILVIVLTLLHYLQLIIYAKSLITNSYYMKDKHCLIYYRNRYL